MSLKLLTFAALAATAQAACTADETKKQTDCAMEKIKNAADAQDKTKMCAYYQGVLACSPSCYCDDAKNKAGIDATIKAAEDGMKAQDVTCALKCGAGSALAPGMALTLALMVAARLYE